MLTGCQQRTVGELLGPWVGRPDTAAAQAEREAEKFGDVSTEFTDESVDSRDTTDWEQYDLTVRFDFVSSKMLEMSLGDGSQKVASQWGIVETSPTGCTIEVVTSENPHDQDSNQTGNVVRRFQLELDYRDGECVGFLLSEVGADRNLGTLYFRRPENS